MRYWGAFMVLTSNTLGSFVSLTVQSVGGMLGFSYVQQLEEVVFSPDLAVD